MSPPYKETPLSVLNDSQIWSKQPVHHENKELTQGVDVWSAVKLKPRKKMEKNERY